MLATTDLVNEGANSVVSGQSEDFVEYSRGVAKMMKRWSGNLLRMKSSLLAAAAALRTCFQIVSQIFLENKDFKQHRKVAKIAPEFFTPSHQNIFF